MLDGYLRLQAGGGNWTVEINTGLVPRLLAEVALARRSGMEIGGLLLGTFPRAAQVTLRIEDFVPVGRRNGDAPQYSLTAEQRARFSATRRRLIENGKTVLGFFRSHLRETELGLSPEDRNLLTIEFRKAIYATLLINAAEPHTAGFVFPDGDGVLPAGGLREDLTFDAGEAAASARRKGKLVIAESSGAPAIETVKAAREPRLTPGSVWFQVVLAAAILLVCLCLTLWAPVSAGLVLHSPHGLRLHVRGAAAMVEIDWNGRDPDLQSAREAWLTVREGSAERTISLSRPELLSGRAIYQPQSAGAPIEFRMRIGLSDSSQLTQAAEWALTP